MNTTTISKLEETTTDSKVARAADQKIAAQIAAETVVIECHIGTLGVRRRVSSDRVETDADKDQILVAKDILDRKELKRIRKHDSRVRADVRRLSVPVSMLDAGHYLLPIELIETIEARWSSYLDERETAIDEFMERYDEMREQARARLGSLYDDHDYPHPAVLRGAFTAELKYKTTNVPAALKQISAAVHKRETERVQREFAQSIDEIRTALREGFAQLVERMVERLTPTDEGDKKVFRDSFVEHLHGFLDTFDGRNLTNDDELQTLVGKARKLVDGIDPQTLRGDDNARARIHQGFTALASKMSALVVERPRAVTFEDE